MENKHKTTKTELIKRIADATGAGQRTTRKVINAFLSEIASDLNAGNDVMLDSFGKFYTTKTKPRTMTNKNKGDGVVTTYGATYRIGFKPSKRIKPKERKFIRQETLNEHYLRTGRTLDYLKRTLNLEMLSLDAPKSLKADRATAGTGDADSKATSDHSRKETAGSQRPGDKKVKKL